MSKKDVNQTPQENGGEESKPLWKKIPGKVWSVAKGAGLFLLGVGLSWGVGKFMGHDTDSDEDSEEPAQEED